MYLKTNYKQMKASIAIKSIIKIFPILSKEHLKEQVYAKCKQSLKVKYSAKELTASKISEHKSESWMAMTPIHRCSKSILLAEHPIIKTERWNTIK